MHDWVKPLVRRLQRLRTQVADWLQLGLYYLGIKRAPLVSIIINNYNYARFLPAAIESALAQRYPKLEVIVVDDGSTDDSQAVIASYEPRLIPIFQRNAGQAAAFNTGFERSRGQVILFLDADDMLRPTAALKAVLALQSPTIVKAHWHQQLIDATGNLMGALFPDWELADGDLRALVMQHDLQHPMLAPTSGNAWKRSYLQRVCPVEEMGDKHGVDEYLCWLAPLYGELAYIPVSQGYYRMHGQNHRSSNKRTPLQKTRNDLHRREFIHQLLDRHLAQQGVAIDPAIWRNKPGSSYTWFKDILDFHDVVDQYVPQGVTFLLVDANEWHDLFMQHQPLPFPQRHGQYDSALPPDAATLIQSLEDLRQQGADFIVFAWTQFWWFEAYPLFHQHLQAHYDCVVENHRCAIFDLATAHDLDRRQVAQAGRTMPHDACAED